MNKYRYIRSNESITLVESELAPSLEFASQNEVLVMSVTNILKIAKMVKMAKFVIF